ncbi:MAG: hypothetical protein NC033_00595 [Clostridiales bacterium]|nr:hypothetical protein [Clostridiales bacterium]
MTEIEELRYAKALVENLARGVNPLSGEAVSDTDVINNVKISRCLFYVANMLEKLCQGEYVKKENKGKTPFFIKEGELENFDYSDGGIAISEIIKRINDIVGYDGRKIKRSLIVDWLIESGLIAESETNGRKYKLPTDKGIEAGIYTEERFGYNGSYRVVLYNEKAQRMIIEHLKETAESDITIVQQTADVEPSGSNKGKAWDGKQEAELTEMFKDGLTVKAIADAMKRSRGAIKARLIKLGLIKV